MSLFDDASDPFCTLDWYHCSLDQFDELLKRFGVQKKGVHGLYMDYYGNQHLPFLHKAVAKNRKDLVERLLQEPTWNWWYIADEDGYTALHTAAELGHDTVLEVLLRRNKESNAVSEQPGTSYVDHTTSKGLTALMLSSMKGHDDTIQILLSHGAKIGFQTSNGVNALMMAAQCVSPSLTMLLKEGSIFKNTRDNDGRSALDHAAIRAHHESVHLLLEDEDIKSDLADGSGHTPLYWLGRGPTPHDTPPRKSRLNEYEDFGDFEKTFQLLLNQSVIRSRWLADDAADILMSFAQNGVSRRKEVMLSEILQQGRIDTMVWKGEGNFVHTLLAKAIELGHLDFIDNWLHYSSERPDVSLGIWQSTLSQALSPFNRNILKGTKRILEYDEIWSALCCFRILSSTNDGHKALEISLSGSNFDFKRVDEYNRNLLWHALNIPDPDITRSLLELDADILEPGNPSVDPILSKAAKLTSKEWPDILELIIRRQFQLMPRLEVLFSAAGSNEHWFCLHLLKTEPELLRKKSDDGTTILIHASKIGNHRLVTSMLREKQTVLDEDSTGRTALDWAAREGHLVVVKFLFEQDESSWVRSCSKGDVKTMSVLLEMGLLTPQVQDETGRTPLHFASESGNIGLAELLLANGADVNARIHDRMTPFQIACQSKQPRLVDLFLGHDADLSGITRQNWFNIYTKKDQPDTILEVSESLKAKKVRFVPSTTADPQMHESGASTTRTLLRSCPDYEPIHKLSGLGLQWIRKQSTFTERLEDPSAMNLLQLCHPYTKFGDTDRSLPCEMKTTTAHWKTMIGVNVSPEQATIEYATTLPLGWLPKDSIEFLTLHCEDTEKRWLDFCDIADVYLAELRIKQIEAKGESHYIIDQLARDARTWAMLWRQIRIQTPHMLEASDAAFRHQRKNLDSSSTVNDIKASWDKIAQRITQLSETSRELLQLELAWVSIREAHLSTSLGTSMKRLSWITFIFLPITSTASIFGMNVDLFKDNPQWWWFVIVSCVVLALTFTVWLSFKHGKLETRIEGLFGRRKVTSDEEARRN